MSTGQYPGQSPEPYERPGSATGPQQYWGPPPAEFQQPHPAPQSQQVDSGLPPGAPPPRRKSRALPWIIVGAALVVLAAAAVAVWVFVAQTSERDQSIAAHARAVASYENSWEVLQERIEESVILFADAENSGAIDSQRLDMAQERLAEAESIERIEPEDPLQLPGATEIDADTERITRAEEEVIAAERSLSEEMVEVNQMITEEERDALTEAIGLAREVVAHAQDRAESGLAERLSAIIGEAEALLDHEDASVSELRDMRQRLVDETDAVSSAMVPRAEDIDGTWCSDEECQTIQLPKLTSDFGSVTLTQGGTSNEGCFNFIATYDDSPVGGFAVIFCPAGVSGSEFTDADNPDIDRMFQGQATPMQLFTRQ